MCFGNSQTTKTDKTDLPQWLNDAAKNNVGSASNIQNQGFTSYDNPMVAGFSPQQTSSFGLGTDVANGAKPAIGNTGNWLNDYATGSAGSVNPSTIASKMSPYMNQYVMQALAPALEAQDQQFAGQNKSFDSAATGAGAFGDSSYNLGRTNLTNQQNIGRTGLVADAYQRAFNTAIGAGAQDVGNDINAQTTNANLNEQALGRKAAGANAAFQMGTGATNLTNNLGGQQTAADQARINAQYNEFLRQQYQDPQFRSSLMNSAIASGKTGSDTTTTSTAPNNAGYGLIGAGLGAVGTALGGPIGGMAGSAIGGMIANGMSGGGQGAGDSSSGDGSEYADGGAPRRGSKILVGERGPEVFVPHARDIHVAPDVMAAAHAKRAAKTGEIPAYADGGAVPAPNAPRLPTGLPLSMGSGALGQGMVNNGMAPNPSAGSPSPSSPGMPSLPPGFGLMGSSGISWPSSPSGAPGSPPTLPTHGTPGQNGLAEAFTNHIFGMGGGSGNPFANLFGGGGGQGFMQSLFARHQQPQPGQPGAPHPNFGMQPHPGQFGQPGQMGQAGGHGFRAFADGGYVDDEESYQPEDQSQPYVIGQDGPQVIQPQTDGVVIPNEVVEAQQEKDQLGAGAPPTDQEFKPPLFLQSGIEAPPQPPQSTPPGPPARSPMRGTAALGNPRGQSPAQQDLATLQNIRDNPGQTALAVGQMAAPGAGTIIKSALENATEGKEQRGMAPLNAPRAKPKSDAVSYPNISTVFDALNPVASANAADGKDPRPVEVIPEPTQKEASEIERINTKIEAQKPKLARAIKQSKYSDPQKDPAVISAKSEMNGLQAELDRVSGPTSELGRRRTSANADYRDELKAWNGRQSAITDQLVRADLPFAVRNKEKMDWAQDVIPKVSAGTGAVIGMLRGNPVMKMAKAAGAGAFEGGALGAWPTFEDGKILPPGENWRDAVGRIYDGDEKSKDFWKRVGAGALEHATIASGTAGTTALGKEFAGAVGRGVGSAANKTRDWFNRPPVQRPPQATPPSQPAPAAPPAASPAPNVAAPRAAVAAQQEAALASAPAAAVKTKVEPQVLQVEGGKELKIFKYPDGKTRWYHDGTRIDEATAAKLRALPTKRPGEPLGSPGGAEAVQ